MPGLWRKNPKTPEGKYPIVLRRDGTPLEARYFVLALKDPAAAHALMAYATKAAQLGYDPAYCADLVELAHQARDAAAAAVDGSKPADPTAPPHRKDDPAVLAWARSIGCPGA